MNLYDENLKPIDQEILVSKIMNEKEFIFSISQEEAIEAADEMYSRASDAFNELLDIPADLEFRPSGFVGLGKKILEWIRKQICKFLNPESTRNEIINKILEELAKIMPFGIIIEKLVIKVVRYFLNAGYQALCMS